MLKPQKGRIVTKEEGTHKVLSQTEIIRLIMKIMINKISSKI